tara:strand:+ start:167 stop:598 length:432 start_codon:yes stop_codon:yes gene_type:complete
LKKSINIPKLFVIGFFGLGFAVFVAKVFQPETEANNVKVSMTDLSDEAKSGQLLFDNNCAACHGVNASGTDKGPPLVHDIYNPGHHPDEAFYGAVANGVSQHHWPFGNMPKQNQVTADEVTKIVRYVREMQLANGITYKPHKM